MLRSIAESDYRFDAKTVGKWTLYQLRMYLADKEILATKKTFSTYDEAKEFLDNHKTKSKPRLASWQFVTGCEQ